MKNKDKLTKYDAFFLIPGLTVFVLFMIIPLLLSFYYAFTNWNGISNNYHFTGLKNFKMLFKDQYFIRSFRATIILTIITTLLGNIVGIVLAAIIEPKTKVNALARTFVFIPAILSGVVVSFIWAYMTQTNGGIINLMLNTIGLPGIDLYKNADSMLYMVSFVIAWAALGFYTTVYIANMGNVNESIYEAANIDGASKIRQFFSITVPLIRPAIVINTTTAIIWGLKQYDFVKVMVPGSVQTIPVYSVERAFEYNMFGYASSMVLVLLAFTLIISGLQVGLSRKKELDV